MASSEMSVALTSWEKVAFVLPEPRSSRALTEVSLSTFFEKKFWKVFTFAKKASLCICFARLSDIFIKESP